MAGVNASNAVYWLRNPLERSTVQVLKRIKDGTQYFFNDRFDIAFLIALDCVKADCDNQTLAITEKGEDALQFFSEEE